MLFTVEVSDPENRLESIVIDLSPIGGSSYQSMYDDGSHGDEDAEDNVYSFIEFVPSEISEGEKSLDITITYGQGESVETSITLDVNPQEQDGELDDGPSDGEKEEDNLWLILLLIAVFGAAVLGAVGLAVKRRRPRNEVFVAPLYKTGYYKKEYYR